MGDYLIETDHDKLGEQSSGVKSEGDLDLMVSSNRNEIDLPENDQGPAKVSTVSNTVEAPNKYKVAPTNDEDDDDNLDENNSNLPPMGQENRQHLELIKKLRLQLRDLEKYAYERGELDEVPVSIIAEKQTVILDILKKRLSLNIDLNEIETSESEELKKQVDKEIQELIDPLIGKEHLISQLRTQLTDVERYISHLHGTLGKDSDKKNCLCQLHGCSSQVDKGLAENECNNNQVVDSNIVADEAMPKTSRLIRSLVTQLICSDIKLKEKTRKEQAEKDESQFNNLNSSKDGVQSKSNQFNDGAAWYLHLDKVILATDSLVNLFTMDTNYSKPPDKSSNENLVESVVRRQLVPALRDLLSYGLIDPNTLPRSTSYASFLFDPYYLLSSLTCFPSSNKSTNVKGSMNERIHVWSVIEDYFKTKNEPGLKSSSVKTLSQSFNLAPSISGPIKITSKQALLIIVDDIIETLANSKPNGPESHFRAFIYTSLNRGKLCTWLRFVFRSKSLVRKFYHNFSFVCQSDKVDKLLKTIEPLSRFEFQLKTDVESIEHFVSAF